MATCAEVVARTLKENGISTIFGLPGGEVLDFLEACRREGLSFVLTRHEAAAAFMADVTGQITRRPGVCLSTLGPGATNLVSGVANAFLDRSPVLAITGQMSTRAAPYCTHQRIDLSSLFQPVTKQSIVLDARNTRSKVERAIEIATQGRMGPVHLLLPSDMAAQQDESYQADEAEANVYASYSDERLMEKALAELNQARHPLVIVGVGVDPVGSSAIIADFIEKTRIPVMVTPKAKGLVSETNPLFLATAAGMAGDRVIVEFLQDVDLVVGIGFDPVESDKMWHKEKKILSIDTASTADGSYAPFLELIGDVNAILTRFLTAYTSNHAWEEKKLRAFRDEMREVSSSPVAASRRGLSPYHVILKLRQLLSPNAVLTTDVGAHKLLLGQLWETYEPLTFFMSNGFSSMGYGFPAAMAARLQFPDREVVSVSGETAAFS
ncbi:MAG: thiamine pyrophosphate-binding protein [Dehalococcoidales bacterium]|nr:thiamine pyrophosphate-binding protein [Dehalococcoidales bacterium]